MTPHSSRSKVTFTNAFKLPGYTDALASGQYDVLVEEELMQGLRFAAYRKIATYLVIKGRGHWAGRTEMRPITGSDLETALHEDRAMTQHRQDRDAALSPQ